MSFANPSLAHLRLKRSLERNHLDASPFDLPLTDPRHPFHLEHMAMALDEAAAAAEEDEVPVGAVIVSFTKASSAGPITSGNCSATRPPTPR